MRTTRFSGHHYMQHWGEYTWYPHPIPSCIPAPWYTHPHLSGIPTQYSLVYPPSPKGPGPRDTPTRKGPRTSHTLPQWTDTHLWDIIFPQLCCGTVKTYNISKRFEKKTVFYAADIRLVEGDSPRQGRVEVFHDGEWGTVCTDTTAGFTSNHGQVICTQLGYDTFGAR